MESEALPICPVEFDQKQSPQNTMSRKLTCSLQKTEEWWIYKVEFSNGYNVAQEMIKTMENWKRVVTGLPNIKWIRKQRNAWMLHRSHLNNLLSRMMTSY
jgi:hypothetical protein